MIFSKWKKEPFYIGVNRDNDPRVHCVNGYTYKGIGVFKRAADGLWVVTHLGTGHKMFCIDASRRKALKISAELANGTNWFFTKLPEKDDPSYNACKMVRNSVFEKWQPYTRYDCTPVPANQIAACAAARMNGQ